jgi:hypothetical protein
MAWEIGTPIPDDWAGEADGYAVGLFLFPDSPRWGLVVRTVLRVLSRGRFWGRESGAITEAQDAGRLAYMSFTYVSFSDLLDAVGGVREAIEGLRLQTQVSVACCDQLSPPDPPVPPPEELPPPGSDPGDVPPAYGGDAAAYDAELCRSANALHWLVRRYLVALTRLDTVGGAIAIAVALLAIVFPEGASTVIGGVSLAAIVAALVLIEGGLETVAAWAEDAVVYWDSVQQEMVCSFYTRIGLAESWKDGVAGDIVSRLQSVVSAAPMPDSAIETAVDWLGAFLNWLERDIYDGLATLEGHPEPVSCAGCDEPAAPGLPAGYRWALPSSITETSSDPSTTSLDIGASVAAYAAYLDSSGTTWDPALEFGVASGVATGESVVGRAFFIVENQASGGNDPGGSLCRIGGFTEEAGFSRLVYSDGAGLPPEIPAMFDQAATTGSSNWPPSTGHGVGFYRRAGVTGSPGPIEAASARVLWLVEEAVT